MARPILYRARFLLPITAPPIEDGAVVIENGCICAVDTHSKLTAAYPDAAVIDFGDSVLLPPMVNAHTHLELSHFADWAAAAAEPKTPQAPEAPQAPDVSQKFVDWILWLVRVRRNVGEVELQSSLAEGLRKSLNAGTGAVGDILTTLSAASGYRYSPLRGRIFAEILGQDPAVVGDRLAAIEGLSLNPPGADLDWGLSPHAPYTLSSTTMNQVFAFADRKALQCSIHLAESMAETDFMQNGTGAIPDKLFAAAKWKPSVDSASGCSPVSALCRQGRLRSGDLVVHGVQVDATDIEQLKQTGCSVVLCPRSNAALNVGKAPVAAYLNAGVPLALGTDSLASSSSLSIWDEMAFAMDWFAGEAEPRDWLELATLGGAKALGLHDQMGQLSPGYEASFQVVTIADMPCIDALEETLCASGRDVKVTHLYLAGRQAFDRP
jgi:cytosine/adenosine deaminase-related metal-dependent hydrolase